MVLEIHWPNFAFFAIPRPSAMSKAQTYAVLCGRHRCRDQRFVLWKTEEAKKGASFCRSKVSVSLPLSRGRFFFFNLFMGLHRFRVWKPRILIVWCHSMTLPWPCHDLGSQHWPSALLVALGQGFQLGNLQRFAKVLRDAITSSYHPMNQTCGGHLTTSSPGAHPISPLWGRFIIGFTASHPFQSPKVDGWGPWLSGLTW